ncbi:COX15/CtaA family [Entophlyctis helioformis]|nr:COX15/CtaA family [Entophlyctis helioformis]
MSTAAGATSGVAASGEGEADDADSRKRQSQSSSSSSSDSLAANRPIVGYWYLFSSALVFGIVVLGGLTRLTESGLSIVEWNVIKGMKPPRSQQEWEDEFNKYKQFPEYKLLNHNITLDEFKFIFYMEWAHRMLGRFIGLSFVIPGAYFAYKGFMTPSIQKRSLVVATLIGGQGVLGWFMVKSGLSDELLEKPFATPRVSHYWLTAHLTSAFVIYSIMFYTGVSIVRATWTRNAAAAFKPLVSDALKSLRSFRKYTHYTAGLIFLTAMSGALVAGLDAGLIYNEFPYMGNGIIPEDFWSLSTLTDRNPQPISAFRNVLENPVAVQFNHRLLACTTFTVISALWVYSRRLPLPGASRIAANAVMAVAVAQVTLGISTLLYLVPVPLAAAHQAGSLTLLTTSLWLMHTLRVIPK